MSAQLSEQAMAQASHGEVVRKSGNSVRYRLRPVSSDHQEGFLRHPDGFPLRCRRLLLEQFRQSAQDSHGDVGVIFRSGKFIRPGTRMEISIPLRGEVQKFKGEVVMVRASDKGYEIGFWLDNEQDCGRARLVEQICQLENHLREREKPANQDAQPSPVSEWLTRVATTLHLI